MKKILALASAAAVVAALVVAGTALAAPKKYRIFMNPKFTGLSYFEVCANGAKEAAKELGVDFTYTGSEQADVQLQVQSLENIVAQKPDAIVVSAIDLNAVAPPLEPYVIGLCAHRRRLSSPVVKAFWGLVPD